MAEIKKIYDDAARTNQVYPQTHEKAVVDNNGTTAETKFGLLQGAYEALTQSDIVVVADHTAVASPQANTIYREQGTTTYSDWMYYDGAWKEMAVYNNNIPSTENTSNEADLDIADDIGNVLAQFFNGHFKTKFFNSETDTPTKSTDTNKGDFEISDENNYVLLRLKDGHIKTMLFDSSSIKLENLSEDLNLLINEAIHQGIPNNLAIVFKKVCCIGDSLTAGFTRIGSVDIGSAAARPLKNNWPGYMEKLTGNEYVNLAIGSSTAHHWRYEDGPYSDYKPDFDLANDTTFDAYIVALGVNDERNNLTVGTTSDIATDKSLNSDTFCGNYDYIVRQLMEWNEKAHIFCLTIPLSEGNKVVPYNAIISEIGNLYPNKVHVLSLEGDDVDLSWIAANFANGHYCPIVYNYFASVIFKRISAFVKNNNILVRETPYK